MPAGTAIKEEEEFGGGGNGGDEGPEAKSRRLSGSQNNPIKSSESGQVGFEAANQLVTFRRSEGGANSEDEDDGLSMFAHDRHGPPGVGATIPRTFSTSALRIKNRCSFWDRMYTPRYSGLSKWDFCFLVFEFFCCTKLSFLLSKFFICIL